MNTGRRCPVCGASLENRDPRTATCSGACRAEMSRLRRLLAGETADGYRCLHDYYDARHPAHRTPEKISPAVDRIDPSTRTGRARRFVLDRVDERPGHRTSARQAYAAYLRWCAHAEPEAPLSYGALLTVLDGWAPHEGRDVERRAGRRGRPGTVFVGIVVRRAGAADVGDQAAS
jgi:hypothetical protein